MGSATRRRGIGALLVLAAASSAAFALAQVSAPDKAAAEALFNEARRLMAAEQFADACPKFAASQQLDPGVGTLLNLAVCFEKNGQTASAWATFKEAATAATSAGQVDRAKLARDHAASLEPTLAKLTIVVDPSALVTGLEVRRDGTWVAHATFGLAVPVDPGDHIVEAHAPKRKTFMQRLRIAAHDAATMKIGPLESEPEPPPVASTAPSASASATPPPAASTTPSTTASTTPPPRPSSSATAVVPPPPAPRGDLQRTIGSICTVTGTLGLIGGGVAALMAKLTYDDSNVPGKCTGNNCTQQGLDKRDLAFTMGNIGTAGIIGGSIFLAGGIVILLTAPSSEPAPSPQPVRGLRVAPSVGTSGAGLWLNGSF